MENRLDPLEAIVRIAFLVLNTLGVARFAVQEVAAV